MPRLFPARKIAAKLPPRWAAFALSAVCACVASGADAPAGGTDADQLRVLRTMLEQQSRQIDVLAQEVARLNMLLEGKAGAAPVPAPGPGDAAAPAGPSAVVTIPKTVSAEPAPGGGPVHIIAKGETLTAIAKRYKVTVPELLKVNKIADVRKLQIGQTLVLPPGAKMPEPPASKPAP